VLLFARLANLSTSEPVHAAVLSRFWQQGILVLAALAGLGLAPLQRIAPASRSWRALLLAAAVAASAFLCARHFGQADQRGRTTFREQGLAILAALPERAILVITSDEAIGAVRYLQQVEGLRRDVRVLPAGQLQMRWIRRLMARQMPEIVLPPEPSFSFRRFVDLNLPRTRVFLANRVPWEQTLEEAYSAWGSGLADEVLKKGETPPLTPWIDASLRSFAHFPRPQPGRDGAWEHTVQQGGLKQVERFATHLPTAVASRGADPDVAREVVRALEPLARWPSAPPVVWRNLGVAYQFLSAAEPGARTPMVAAFRRYLELAPPQAPDRELIARAIAAAEPATAPR
jgi:hypothetical protein